MTATAETVGRRIRMEGFGSLRGKQLEGELVKVTPQSIVLRFVKPNGVDPTEFGFRPSDGNGHGREYDKDGFRIPEAILRELTNPGVQAQPEPKAQAKPKTPVEAQQTQTASTQDPEEDEEDETDDTPPVSTTKKGKATVAATATATAETANKPTVKKFKIVGKASATPAKANGAQPKNLGVKAKVKPAATPEPETEETPGKKVAVRKAGAPPASTATRGRGRPPAVDAPTLSRGEALIKFPDGLFNDLTTRYAKRFGKIVGVETSTALKANLKASTETNKTWPVVLNKALGEAILSVLVVARKDWDTEGVSGAAKRRGAFRLAGEIGTQFKLKVPAELKDPNATPPAKAQPAVAATPAKTAAKSPVNTAAAKPTGKKVLTLPKAKAKA